MKRIENRAEKAIRAGQKAAHCAALQPVGLCDAILTRAEGRKAEAESQELLKPVGEIIRGAGGEVFHADPRQTEFERSTVILHNTLEYPNMIAVHASENRTEAALQAGVLEAALDAAVTAGAENSLEKMLAHQMAAAHSAAMKLVGRGIKDDDLPPVEMARLTNAAARMMQVYQEGLLALHKIRTGGKQVVVVQHVQVSGGGQAVIAGNMKAGDQGSAADDR